MPLLLLIRHGENDYTRKGRLAGRLPGVHLNENGRKQAEDLASALAHVPIRAVYSSPLDRAVETAEPIAKALKQQVKIDAGLIEADVGEWQGKSLRRLALTRYWRVIQGAPSRARHPGGESFMQTQTRIVNALEAISAKFKPKDIVAVVFHADPIRLAVAHYIGLPLDNFQRLSCETGSATLLAVRESRAHLLWMNRRPPVIFAVPEHKHK